MTGWLWRPWTIAALLVLTVQTARADGAWDGFWESYSFGDDAYLSLRQEGATVTGIYFPYDGRIEGVAKGSVLRGTWRSPNGSGTLVFTLSPDGRQFSGVVDSGEWWNGRRIEEDDIEALSIDLTSPSHAIRSFMESGRAFRRGEISGLQAMFSSLHFAEDPGFATKSRRAQLLYDVLTLTTFRVFEVRPPYESAGDSEVKAFDHRFGQSGTEEGVSLTFRPDVFELWRIDVPEAAFLEGKLRSLLAARGQNELDPNRYRHLASPRHTVEAFIAGMERWHLGGADLVRRTFDFSAVSERLQDWRLPIVATYMAGNLNRIGRLTLEELPDDPKRRKPYVYYQHPAGKIVLSPYFDGEGVTRWRFTAATLSSAKTLHDALRLVPFNFENVRNPQADSPYFTVRSFAFSLSPGLTKVVGGVELWQWLGLILFVALLPGALHLKLRPLERSLSRSLETGIATLRSRYTVVVQLFAVGVLWLLASTVLGLPDRVSGPLYAGGLVLLIAGVSWQLYRFINLTTQKLHTLTQRTATNMDDVAVTLLSGLAKVVIVIGAAVAIADVLGMPYQTVLAGVGVSGLAFAIAARDVIANLFGSAVIASDRPFQRGDFISVGDITGTVEEVGLRSTRVRPVDDTTVTIPNNAITTDRVVNISKRRKIRVLETIHIAHDSSVAAIGHLRERIRDELLADEMVSNEAVRVGLSTISLYAVDVEVSFYIKTTNYDEYVAQKHRLLAHLLAVIEAAGVERAVIRKD